MREKKDIWIKRNYENFIMILNGWHSIEGDINHLFVFSLEKWVYLVCSSSAVFIVQLLVIIHIVLEFPVTTVQI